MTLAASRRAPHGVGGAAAIGAGFTLIELVMVVATLGIVSIAAARFVAQPVDAYLATASRSRLVDRADTALARMTREIRLALPNSVRVSSDARAVEFLRVLSAGRYREEPPGDPLDFNALADTFDVIGTLPDADLVAFAGGASVADCVSGSVDCVVIYNTGQAGADAYAGDNLAAVTAASAGSLGFSAATPFPHRSPGNRFYVVDTPVSFVCEGGSVYRYADYPVVANHASADSGAELKGLGAAAQLVVDGVSACDFAYEPGTATRSGTVRLTLTLTDNAEQVSLLQQANVGNAP